MSLHPAVLLAALHGLGALLLPSSAEGQLQAAWKFSKEGNTDNQAFISINGHSASLPSVLGQLFGGTSSISDFLGLVQAAQVSRGGTGGEGGLAAPPFTTPHVTNNPLATNITLLASPQVQDNSSLPAPPPVQDDRPVPGAVDVGADGLVYFLSNETFDRLPGCQNYCHRFRGFRLAIAKTNLTLIQMRKYVTVQINLSIQRKPDGIKYVWGDGSELDRSFLLPNEPIMNNGLRSDRVAIYGHGSNHFLDDAECCYGSHKTKCLCQGSFAPTTN